MDRDEFEGLVTRAIENLPKEFKEQLENIDIVVEDYPTRFQLSRLKKGEMLLGLYEGVPHTERSSHYGLVPPDKISIFQKPIEAICRENRDITREVERVVKHEIAHHFGIGDAKLDELERRSEKSGRHLQE